MSSKRKHMRLPNGFGQISKISGRNLRNPYRAMITVGKTETGRPICKLLKPKAYFRTYNEAYAALLEYNKNPFDLNLDPTMSELYYEWSEKHFERIENSSAKTHRTAWTYCDPIKNIKVRQIRSIHIRRLIENADATLNVKHTMKSLLNLMFDYAVEYELTDRNYARQIKLDIDDVDHENHIPFTDEEIDILWNSGLPFANIILIQCYSGWRPGEFSLLTIDNVDLEAGVFISGLKTTAGRNRPVPIHSRIRPLVEEFYNLAVSLDSKYLFNIKNEKTGKYVAISSYDKFKYQFVKTMTVLNITSHKAHDGRAHFITKAKDSEVNEYAIKYMVGHRINDITESVYAKRNIEWLRSEIEKIK